MYKKMDVEIIRDFDGRYCANVWCNGIVVEGLPEYVTYRELSKAIEKQTGFRILPLRALKLQKVGRKHYGYFNNYEKHDGLWDPRAGTHPSAVYNPVHPMVSSALAHPAKVAIDVTEDNWTDCCDEHLMLLRQLPGSDGDVYECLKVVSHPDDDETLSVLHETVFLEDYLLRNRLGEPELCHILAGFGFADLDDYVHDHYGSDDWVYRADGTVDREASPSWKLPHLDLAMLICESHDYGIKMTPEDAQHIVHRITGKSYSLDWFQNLAGCSFCRQSDSIEHLIHNAMTCKTEDKSAETHERGESSRAR